MDPLARFRPHLCPLLVTALEHPLRNIEPRHAMSGFGQRQSDPSCPAPQFQHRAAVLEDRITVERNISNAPPYNRRLVVIIRNKSIVKRAAHEVVLTAPEVIPGSPAQVRSLSPRRILCRQLERLSATRKRVSLALPDQLPSEACRKVHANRPAPAFQLVIDLNLPSFPWEARG